MPVDDFYRLELMCRRITSLPVLPTTALQLVRTIDTGDASAAEIEKIIVSDPNLSADFLRLASSSQIGKTDGQLSSIRAGIIRMGQRTVRSLATSLLVRDLVPSDPNSALDKKHFARHSLAVGLLTKYMYVRRKMIAPFESKWTADEMFAAGLLYDLGYLLLGKLLPEGLKRLYHYAEKNGASLDDTFQAVFEKPASALGATAAKTWGLPDIFIITLTHAYAPWELEEEVTALSCLHLASALAKDFGLGMETWPLEVAVPPQVFLEVPVPEEEKENLHSALLAQLDAFEGKMAA